ncbi:MAG TPA: type I secretion system permease/ATPase [Arsenophonus nasoniae]|uniref:type I secretion system permease/ATPase n=1 Tax=Arsenophonus nasoniae TaxID=638 RepID=UPI00387A1599
METFSTVAIANHTTNQALDAIIWLGKRLSKSITIEQLTHSLGLESEHLTDWQLRECADFIQLKSKVNFLTLTELEQIPLPALIEIEGIWWVFTNITQQIIEVINPCSEKTLTFPHHNNPNSPIKFKVLLVAEKKLTAKKIKFGLDWFSPSVLRQNKQLRDIFILASVVQIFALIHPILFQHLIDKVLVGRSLNSLHVLAFAVVSLAIAEPIYSFIRNKIFNHTSGQINAELSGRLYRHLLGLPLDYFKQRQTGQIIARVREMAQIRQFLTGSTLMLFIDLFFVTLFITVLFNYSALLASIVVGSLVIYFIFWLLIGPIIRKRVEKEYEAQAENTTFLTESITGIETIKTTATENRFLQRWQKILSHQLQKSFQVQKSSVIASQIITLVNKITTAILLWFGVKAVMQGQLSPGELIAFNMLSVHVTQPILRLAQVWQDFQHTLIALKRVGDILDEPTEFGQTGLTNTASLEGNIEFNHIRFRYASDMPEVLQNLSLSIKAGQFIGITGPSGSGKSTLTKLLQRLYIPQQGQITIDGMDLAVADPMALRLNMSVVLQESILFAGSIADNIRLSQPAASDEAMTQAAQMAGALDFIQQLPQGFNTQLAERGMNLSGGQRQRIALARALLTQPRILILDEATSALDYDSEAAIMKNMQYLSAGRTVISIAHRLNTIRHADKICVINEGQVIEFDSHDNLLKLNGFYAQLWYQQIGSKAKINA